MINRNACAICDGMLINIYKLPNMPVSLSCTSVPCCDKYTLSYAICENCNTIQLDKLIPLDILYSESHNFVSVGEIWKNYFECFCSKISTVIEKKNGIRDWMSYWENCKPN